MVAEKYLFINNKDDNVHKTKDENQTAALN